MSESPDTEQSQAEAANEPPAALPGSAAIPGWLSGIRAPRLDAQDIVNSVNQRIFDTSLDLIFVVDSRGTFLRVSPSARSILGYDPAEMIGNSALGFIHLPNLMSTREEMRRARRGRETRNFECCYVHKDGRVVPLSWMGVWSEPDQQHFFIGRDITEREVNAQRLRQAQRMDAIGQLTGGMAHDFNNLLAIIIGNLDLMRMSGSLMPDDDELAQEALDAAIRGADLTARLLAFARRQPLQPERVQVNELVESVAGLLGRTLGERIPIVLDLADDVWPVVVDPAQLEASLVNLATNARDAMPRGGKLVIATANRELDAEYAAAHADLAAGDFAMIEVSDTGTGIPSDVMERVFEPFFTTKEQGKGTGLGLSMVFGFVKQSGGHVNVYSEAGTGTTFRLYLPRDPSGSPVTVRRESAMAAGGGNEPLLVVDDNEGIRRVVKRQLSALGYQVVEAGTAAEALEVLERERVVLLFTDVVMPGDMDGTELARAAMSRWPGLKVVLTSGFPEALLSGNSEAASGLRLLSKPYRSADLARMIREVLDLPADDTE